MTQTAQACTSWQVGIPPLLEGDGADVQGAEQLADHPAWDSHESSRHQHWADRILYDCLEGVCPHDERRTVCQAGSQAGTLSTHHASTFIQRVTGVGR